MSGDDVTDARDDVELTRVVERPTRMHDDDIAAGTRVTLSHEYWPRTAKRQGFVRAEVDGVVVDVERWGDFAAHIATAADIAPSRAVRLVVRDENTGDELVYLRKRASLGDGWFLLGSSVTDARGLDPTKSTLAFF